jgi:hypothetical protein
MKNYTNIEKHPLQPKTYLGYDQQGFAWCIEKSNSSFGDWCGVSKHHPNKYIFAFGLAGMSRKLSEFPA